MSSTDFHTLNVSGVEAETLDAVTLKFELPSDLRKSFSYQAGQYLTLRFILDGEDVRRAYSMSSSPLDDELAVTVKRVSGGLVSNHIADAVKSGSQVEVMPPQGRFLYEPKPEQNRDIYLIGAGSGITPLMSILRTALEEEPLSKIYLLYGNKTEDSIIFKAALDELEQKFPDRLFVTHTLSRLRKSKGLSSLWNKKKADWKGLRGRIDGKKIREWVSNHPPLGTEANYYICGPGSLIDTSEQALIGVGVDPDYIHDERFVSAHDASSKSGSTASSSSGALLKATLDGEIKEVNLKPGQSILDGLLEAKHSPPYSCLAGACSTCMAKVTKGGVRMEVCYALDEDEVEAGYVLTCQCFPTTDEVEVDYGV
ncbi:MAG: ferredoxin--NADP reductase [Bacteroidota bacterium]